ncbi:hypothetical protein TSUD_334220 [Trifolium subterraneum]|uniref:Uncharacterized protein n=1 Tax=Trifolium subterraneum TaxID=3900 RepID=A0A2Z6LUU8_TRISU|nr:hypothetical protein TSUD_334220 [Trifolium subterraneum]
MLGETLVAGKGVGGSGGWLFGMDGKCWVKIGTIVEVDVKDLVKTGSCVGFEVKGCEILGVWLGFVTKRIQRSDVPAEPVVASDLRFERTMR